MRYLGYHRAGSITILCLLLCGLGFTQAGAYPSLFESRCASCHSDDSASCDGCHEHRSSLSAETSQPVYNPGEIINVTLDGGSQGGWVRGLLYDQNGTEVDRKGGPTGTGDDGLGSPVTFPVSLQATAPTTPGEYTWSAAWFGAPSSGGGSHMETSVPVTFTVEGVSHVPDEPLAGSSWDRVKALYR
jgi:hypothetical protein